MFEDPAASRGNSPGDGSPLDGRSHPSELAGSRILPDEPDTPDGEAPVRRVILEKPFISRRNTVLNDSVQPRGGFGIHRVPPGSLVGRGAYRAELEDAADTLHDTPLEPESGGASETPPPREFPPSRTDRQIQSGSVSGRPPRRPYSGPRRSDGYRPRSYRPYPGDGSEDRPQGPRVHKEPLSLAEELAEEMSRVHRNPGQETESRLLVETSLKDESVGRLQRLSASELIAEARRYEIKNFNPEDERRHDLIFRILKEKIKLNGLMYGEGTLEILPDGFGFLRSIETHYQSCPDDIYVSPSQIRRFGLKTGTIISGQIRPPKENERYFALLRVEAINYRDPNEFPRKRDFDDLSPRLPNRFLQLENDPNEVETRILDLMVPLGFGQRGLLISPPRAGKTTLLQKIARATLKNHPNLYVFILLIDERPEEVTEMKRQVKGLSCEVVCSTFDEPTIRHLQVAGMVLDKAKRMVEYGQDVMILLDSITRLSRAWNSEVPGKIPNTQNAGALQFPKQFFGSARCVDTGGSLTILATALTETESTVDEAIYEQFEGTGNLKIVLSRDLSEKRIWPALDLQRSCSHHMERILTRDECEKLEKLRRFLEPLDPTNALEMLVSTLPRTPSNEVFLNAIAQRVE